jgi:hypothetical protein
VEGPCGNRSRWIEDWEVWLCGHLDFLNTESSLADRM